MNKKTLVLLAFIIVKFVLTYILVSPEYDLQRDEYLHLDQADHLAWGYISLPPFSSWIAWLIKILGNGYFWVRFFPALFGVFTMVLVWKITETLKGGLFALVLGCMAVLLSAILRLNILFQPNSFDVFFWTLTYYSIVKYISTENSRWFFLTAIAVGFGLLSKYNMIFLLMGLLPAILITGHRKVFTLRNFYIAIGLAFIIVLPNLIWQYKNDFVTYYQLQELGRTQLVNVDRMLFVKEQVLFFLSSIFVIIAALVSFFAHPPFARYRLFFWSFLFSFLLYVYLKAKAYYAIGLYPVLLAFGSVYLERLFTKGWKFYLRPATLVVVAVLSIPLILLAFPYLSPAEIQANPGRYKALGLLRWEDGKDHELPQDFADMLGWRELAAKVDSAYNLIDDKEGTLVKCDNYGQAGAINYYSRFKEIAAVSFNADYLTWFRTDKEIRNIILVKSPDELEMDRVKTRTLFHSVEDAGRVENVYAREYGTGILVLRKPKIDMRPFFKEELKGRRGWE